MRLIGNIALGIILTLGVFGAVLYTSCSKDGCKGVTCLNGGTCSGGICGACPAGIGGNNCEIVYRTLYGHTYAGSAEYTSSIANDTAYIAHADPNNTLQFSYGNDSNYTQMNLTWSRPGNSAVTAAINIANNTSNGSTFSVDTVTVDTFSYSGSGTVNQNSASLNLVETHPNSPAVIVTLSNFVKQ